MLITIFFTLYTTRLVLKSLGVVEVAAIDADKKPSIFTAPPITPNTP